MDKNNSMYFKQIIQCMVKFSEQREGTREIMDSQGRGAEVIQKEDRCQESLLIEETTKWHLYVNGN